MSTESDTTTLVGTNKQSVGGFNVVSYTLKKSKDTEKVKLVLEASVEAITAGSKNLGDVLKALTDHATGDVEVGLALFMNK